MFLFPDIARNQQHRQHHPRRYEQYQAHQTHAQDHPQPQGPPERTVHRDPEKLLERPNRQSEKYPRSPSPRAVFPHKIHREQYSPRSSSPQFLHLLPRSECILLTPLADLRRRGNILPPNREMRSRGIKHVYPAIKRSYRHPVSNPISEAYFCSGIKTEYST